MAMVDLAMDCDGKLVLFTNIAKRQGNSLSYLGKLFAILSRGGQGKSASGPGVSYTLARNASEARILKLILSVDQPVRLMRWDQGSLKGFAGRSGRCLAHELWEGLSNQIHLFLTSVTVANVCERFSLRTNRILLHGQWDGVDARLLRN